MDIPKTQREPGPYDLISGMHRKTYCDPQFLKESRDTEKIDRGKFLLDNNLLGGYGALALNDLCFTQEIKRDSSANDEFSENPETLAPAQVIESLGKYIRNPQFEYDRRVFVKNFSKLDARNVYKGALKMRLRQKNLHF